MILQKVIKYIIIISHLSVSCLFAQDSLYLIATFTGNSLDEPIVSAGSLGDIDGDGSDEFYTKKLQWKDYGYYYADYFDIYFGADILASNNKFHFTVPEELTGSYDSIPIGDINNDGYDDFFIPGYIGTTFPESRLYIYFGSQEIDTSSCLPIALPGFPTTSGDMNSDGKTDLITSNPAYPIPTGQISEGQINRVGEVYLHLGSNTISTIPSIVFKSDSANDGFGYTTDISGDLNGDGFYDLLVTAPLVSIADSISKCYVYFGAENISDQPNLFFQIYENSDLSYVGDINGDRYDDFLISGGWGNPQLYFGSENFSADNFIEFSAYKDIDDFGVGFSGLGDINNDGYDDFAINRLNYINDKNVMVSKLNIYLGSAIVDTIPDFSLEGKTKWGQFGWKVGSLGDLNRDGYDEFYVLAPNFPNYENPLGKVYLYSMKKFVVGVEEENQIQLPQSIKLYQNYPNPFNPSTTLRYFLPSASNVKIIIYDVMGRMIKSFAVNSQSSGTHKVVWDGTNSNSVKVSTGIYIYRFEATSLETNEHFVKSEKLMLVK